MYDIQHCFIWDSTVSEDAGIRTSHIIKCAFSAILYVPKSVHFFVDNSPIFFTLTSFYGAETVFGNNSEVGSRSGVNHSGSKTLEYSGNISRKSLCHSFQICLLWHPKSVMACDSLVIAKYEVISVISVYCWKTPDFLMAAVLLLRCQFYLSTCRTI